MRPKRFTLIATRFLAIILLSATSALCATESVLYRFKGGSDGAAPWAGMIADSKGNLFGTTVYGGGGTNCSLGCGTVFALSPPAAQGDPWTETVLYSFTGGSDGAYPQAGLLRDKAGDLYGTTSSGGIANCSGFDGCGTVFKVSPPSAPGAPWTEKVLYSFAGGTDGGNPWASLVGDGQGHLYGTTRYGGGERNAGTIFQLSPPAGRGKPWTETLLHVFGTDNDGANPVTALTLGKNGAAYGVTFSGHGKSQHGMVYKLKPPAQGGDWSEGILYRFSGANDGANPVGGLVLDQAGNVYGTTTAGGPQQQGVAFEISFTGTTWVETVLYSFTGGADGGIPVGTLVADQFGNLYGTTSSGGQDQNGSVYELSPGASWTETTLYDFTAGRDGSEPNAGLVFGKSGHLFGTTPLGGMPFGAGTLFAVVP